MSFVDWRITDIPDNGNTGAIVRHGSSLLMSNAWDPPDRKSIILFQRSHSHHFKCGLLLTKRALFQVQIYQSPARQTRDSHSRLW
eukprot:SAG22_NODE_60_length_23423_cov_8.445250_3_plen_85_part_00